MPSVSVRNLSLNYGSVEVLKNLNLDVEQGEFIVLLGPSGCGKSTLLNCIAGLLDISEGQIFISNKNVTWAEPKDRGIGMVFQSYALYPQMTAKGNLAFGLKNQGLPRDEIQKRVARASEILQIEPLLNRRQQAIGLSLVIGHVDRDRQGGGAARTFHEAQTHLPGGHAFQVFPSDAQFVGDQAEFAL